MNREKREQYEQGDMGYSGHSVSESHPRFRLVFTHSSALDTDQATTTKGAVFLRTLLFLFAVFACFADIFPSEIQRTLRFRNMNREQRERYEQGGLLGTLRFLFAIFACFAVRLDL